MGLKILGTGSCVPKNIITNDDLSKIIETNDEWIRTRTGICTRHILNDEESLEGLGTEACAKAIEMSGVAREEIGVLILCTLTGDFVSPSGSALIKENLGLSERCITFDMNMGCCGFVYGLQTAAAYLESGVAKYAVVVSSESVTRQADFTDRSTCCLFGDAAGAVVVEKSDKQTMFNFKVNGNATPLYIDRGEDNCPYHTGGGIHKLYMNGQEIYKFAVSSVSARIEDLIHDSGLTGEDISWFYLHQANMRIIDSAIRHTHQPKEKFPHNIEHYGNTSSASIPLLLDEENRKGHIERGQKIILCAFGAGLASAGCLMEW